MRAMTVAAVLALLAGAALSSGASAEDVQVRGYTRSNGTYVQPHVRTAPNNTKADNYGCINHGRC